MPAAMRWASISVLPEPAPASTRMLVSCSSRMRRRDSASIERDLVMGSEPRIRLQFRVLEFGLRLCVDILGTCAGVIAELAVVLSWCVDKAPSHDELTEVSEDLGNRRLLGRSDRHPLL